MWFPTNSKQGLKKHLERKHLKLNNEASPKTVSSATETLKTLQKWRNTYKSSSQLKYKSDECDFWGPTTLTLEIHVRKYHSINITCGMCEFEATIYKSIHLLVKSSNATFVMKNLKMFKKWKHIGEMTMIIFIIQGNFSRKNENRIT